MGLLVLGLSKSHGRFAKALGGQPAIYIGTISYALLMMSVIFEKLGVVAGLPLRFDHAALATRWGVVALLFVTMLMLASFVHHVIESPAKVWLRRIMRYDQTGDFATPGQNQRAGRPAVRAKAV
jgi:peptidoglycan/LPS O-acetylase OafA/YrhL